MLDSSTPRPWLITETGFFYKLPRRVAPLPVSSGPPEVAAAHNEILESMVEAGIVAPGEVSAVRLDEAPDRVLASLTQIESLLLERVGRRQPPGR